MKRYDNEGFDFKYLEKLRSLIETCEIEGKCFYKQKARISLEKKYNIDNIDGVSWLKIENIAIYIKDNFLIHTYELLDHDLTQISGLGKKTAEKIKQRIKNMKDKVRYFK